MGLGWWSNSRWMRWGYRSLLDVLTHDNVIPCTIEGRCYRFAISWHIMVTAPYNYRVRSTLSHILSQPLDHSTRSPLEHVSQLLENFSLTLRPPSAFVGALFTPVSNLWTMLREADELQTTHRPKQAKKHTMFVRGIMGEK